MGPVAGTLQQQGASPSQVTGGGNGGNIFERLLPTAGGILGGIGGAALGAVAAPFTAGVVNPFDLGVAGAGVGGDLGRIGENLATNHNWKNDLGSTFLENAGGQAAGMGIGSVLGKVASGVGNLGSNLASKEAAAESEQAISNAFPDAALNANARANLNFGKSLDLADKLGIDKTPQAFVQAAGAGTGANGVLNGTLDKLVADAGPVNMENYSQLVNNAINDNVGQLGALNEASQGYRAASNQAQKLQQVFENMLQQKGYGGVGSLTMNADPEAALTMLRNIGSQASQYAGSASGSNDAAVGDVFNKVYNGLKEMIYNRPEINAAVKSYTLTPEDESAILNATGGNQQLAGHLIDTINNAKRASDITKVEAQLADMGNAGQKTLQYVNNAIGTGATAKAAANAAMSPIGEIPTSHAAILAKALDLAAKGGSKTLNAGSSVLGGLSKIAPASTISIANLPNDIAPPKLPPEQALANAALTSNNSNGSNNMTPTQTQPNIFSSLVPGSGTSQAYEPLALQALYGMYDPALLNSSLESSATAAANKMAGVQAAEAQLPGLVNLFNQAGGAQGGIGGLLSTLGGEITGGPAGTYGGQAKQMLSSIAQETGIPASELMSPQITQNKSAAEAALENIQALLSALGGQGNTSLLSQLQ